MEVLTVPVNSMVQSQSENSIIQKSSDSSVIVQLHSESGEATGPPLDVPLSINSKQLQLISNSFLENVSSLL